MWWNRYLSPTVGNELFIAQEFAHDRLPYRDYYYAVPPGFVLWSLAVTAVAGPHLIAFWLIGAIFRVAAMWVLYRWLLRVSQPWSATLAVITVCVTSAGDIADFVGWYNYQPFIWAIFAGFCLSKGLEAKSSRHHGWVVLAGLLLGLNLLTKQTTGVIVGCVAGAAATYASWKLHGWRRARLDAAELAVMAILPYALALGWLWQHDALAAHFDQVYVKGPSSKGGLVSSLLRPILLTILMHGTRMAALCAIAILSLVGAIWASAQKQAKGMPGLNLPSTLLFLCMLLMALFVGSWDFDSRFPMIVAIYTGMIGCLWVTFQAWQEAQRTPATAALMHRGLLGAIGFSASFAMSMSWPAFEPMLLPALAVCLALAFELPLPEAPRHQLRAVLFVTCLLLIVVGSWRKQHWPCTWGEWIEPPVFTATEEPETAGLEGFRLSPYTANFYDRVTQAIRAHSNADDHIFIYPHMPMLYGLADRRPTPFCPMHWMDVCPDYIAIEDARRILAEPPRVIVAMEFDDAIYEQGEILFRDGKRSGQRELVAAINQLLPRYVVVESFKAPGTNLPIKVWVRKTPSKEAAARQMTPPVGFLHSK